MLPQGKVPLLDDYGHHPREILVTLQALRAAYPQHRLVLAFQPHRYSRTQALFEEFTAVLAEVDVLLLLEVYAAGETPIIGVDSHKLADNIKHQGKVQPIVVTDEAELCVILPTLLKQGDVLLLQGAGSIGAVAPRLSQAFL